MKVLKEERAKRYSARGKCQWERNEERAKERAKRERAKRERAKREWANKDGATGVDANREVAEEERLKLVAED